SSSVRSCWRKLVSRREASCISVALAVGRGGGKCRHPLGHEEVPVHPGGKVPRAKESLERLGKRGRRGARGADADETGPALRRAEVEQEVERGRLPLPDRAVVELSRHRA